MKSKLSRPFRAPRKVVGKVADQLDAAIEQPPPDGVESDSEHACLVLSLSCLVFVADH